MGGLDNPRINRVYATLRGELQLSLRPRRGELKSHAHLGPQHAEILAAIETGRRDAATEAIRSHLDDGLELVRSSRRD